MSSSGSNRRRRRAPKAGELLDQWKSGDPESAADARAELLRRGPAEIIPLLRTPDEVEQLRGPIPEIRPIHLVCCAVGLNLFLIPFSLTVARLFRSPLPVIIPLVAQVAIIGYGWLNRKSLRRRARRFGLRQIRHAR